MTTPVPVPSPDPPPDVRGHAKFSDNGRYRYWLERRWDDALPRFAYLLLNPSRAGAHDDDPTVRKLTKLTVANGGGGFELVNLFAVMDTRQAGLHLCGAVEETPGENDNWIVGAAERSQILVLGWGDGNPDGADSRGRQAAVRRRAAEVWPLVRNRSPRCFRAIKSGAPGYPGRMPSSSPIGPYVPPRNYP